MAKTVPMHVDPVGRFITDLPFVNARDGATWQDKVGIIFEAPAEHDHARTLLLHLGIQNGTVFLEMTLDVFVTASESIIIMRGREIESGLASLLRNDGGAETTSTGTPGEPSVRTPAPSEPGAGAPSEPGSSISSVTMSSCLHKLPASPDVVTRGDQNAEEEERKRAWLSSGLEEADLEWHTSSGDQGSRTGTSARQRAQPPTTNVVALTNASTTTEGRPGSSFGGSDRLDRTSWSTMWSGSSRSPMTYGIMVPLRQTFRSSFDDGSSEALSSAQQHLLGQDDGTCNVL